MEMCRLCLSTEKENILPLDEAFINNYNLLTNLNVTLFDGMPQYSCQICTDTVKCFIEFREKSIASEATLREIIYSNVKEEKAHDNVIYEKLSSYYKKKTQDIKSEIKEENYDTEFESLDASFDVYDEDNKYLVVKNDKEDVKLKIKIKKKKKKLKAKASNVKKILINGIEDKWFCGICPKTLKDKSDLNNHLDSHKNERKCMICKEQMNSLSQLLAHRLKHIPLKQNRCHICDKRFKVCLYLEHHYRNMHIEGDDKKLFCSECPVTCDTPKKLNSHKNQMHASIKYICDMCSKPFISRTNLKNHIRSHSENKAYVCDMCGFSCKQSGGLKDHKIRKHTPKRVYCNICKRAFLNEQEHERHKCKIKLNVCPVCGLQLNGNSRLSRHMMVHSDIQKYECTRCSAKYKTSAALRAHIDRHDDNRSKECEFCHAKFYTRTVLMKHRRIHTGEKPYVCKVCNKGFTGNYNLKVHMKVHGEYLVNRKNSEHVDITSFTKLG